MVDNMPAIETLSRPSMKPPQSEVKIFNTPPSLVIDGKPTREIELLADRKSFLSMFERDLLGDTALLERKQVGVEPFNAAKDLLLQKIADGDRHALDIYLKPGFLLFGLKGLEEVNNIRQKKGRLVGCSAFFDGKLIGELAKEGYTPCIELCSVEEDGMVHSVSFAVVRSGTTGPLVNAPDALAKIQFKKEKIDVYRNKYGVDFSWGDTEVRAEEIDGEPALYCRKTLRITPIRSKLKEFEQQAA